MNLATLPYYEHNCEHCTHVGSDIIEGQEIDFYICSTESVIARFSSNPSDYWSSPFSLMDSMPDFVPYINKAAEYYQAYKDL